VHVDVVSPDSKPQRTRLRTAVEADRYTTKTRIFDRGFRSRGFFWTSMSAHHEADSTCREVLRMESAQARRCLEISGACNLCQHLESPAFHSASLEMHRLIDAAKNGCCSCRLLLEGVIITYRIHGLKDASSCTSISRRRNLHHRFWEVVIYGFEIYTLPGMTKPFLFSFRLLVCWRIRLNTRLDRKSNFISSAS
jgi:hypothetical protein